jgi:hypothetical protein
VAGTPKRKAWLAKIRDTGGWAAVLEKRAAGATWGTLAAEIGCSRTFFRFMMNNGSEKLKEAIAIANQEYAEHLAEESLDIVDAEMSTREEIDQAKLRAAHRRWLAGVYDREKFGDPKDQPASAPLSIGSLHIQALIQAASRSLPQADGDGTPRQLSSGPSVPAKNEQPASPVSE